MSVCLSIYRSIYPSIYRSIYLDNIIYRMMHCTNTCVSHDTDRR